MVLGHKGHIVWQRECSEKVRQGDLNAKGKRSEGKKEEKGVNSVQFFRRMEGGEATSLRSTENLGMDPNKKREYRGIRLHGSFGDILNDTFRGIPDSGQSTNLVGGP